ncbi:MAG: tetratricopeptide repeat protein, partial [Victivallales bacterium]|nr:tetratricopeptide repeat protein [Victivallales bacterium]
EPDGTGFLYASTRRLQGRKLFVWGNGRGSRNWQRKLVSEGLPDYLEIQGGLAKTQLECLPMPPRTAWEWLEAYGPFQMNDSKAAFGEWSRACEAVAGQVDAILPEPWLDAELLRTRGTFAKRPGRLVSAGSGWGALEELRRGAKFCAHLDFGQPQEEQRPWRELFQTGSLPDVPPDSYVVQPEWDRLLQAARVQTWQTWLHRGLYAFHQGNLALAERRFRKSAKLCKTAWNLFALANCARLHGERRKTIRLMAQAMRLPEADLSLAKECLRVLMEKDVAPAMMLELLDAQPAEHQKRPIFRFFRAWALAGAGRLDEAEELVCADGGLEVPDIREGEASITDLYISIRKKQAAREGKTLEDQAIEVPGRLDLRMS